MNNLAILPHVAMYGLQMQIVNRDVAKKVSLDELKTQTASTGDVTEKVTIEQPVIEPPV